MGEFKVEVEELDGRLHAFRLYGELDHATAPDLREPLQTAIESGVSAYLIDLSDCNFIDSTGLSVIVHARSRVVDEGDGRFRVCSPLSIFADQCLLGDQWDDGGVRESTRSLATTPSRPWPAEFPPRAVELAFWVAYRPQSRVRAHRARRRSWASRSGSWCSCRQVMRMTRHPSAISARSRARSRSKAVDVSWKVRLSSSTMRR